jgi:hypothetical protein
VPYRRPSRGLRCCRCGGKPGMAGGSPARGCPAAHCRAGPPGWRRAPLVGGDEAQPPFVSGSSGRPRTPIDHQRPRSTSTQLGPCSGAIRAGRASPMIRSGSTSDRPLLLAGAALPRLMRTSPESADRRTRCARHPGRTCAGTPSPTQNRRSASASGAPGHHPHRAQAASIEEGPEVVGVGANPEHTKQQGLLRPETHEHERARHAAPNDTRRQQLRRRVALDTEVLAA